MDIEKILDELLALPYENEIVEFKEAKRDFDFDTLGKYFSALSNEANLLNKNCAWLVFWVKDDDHSIVWSVYRERWRTVQDLKREIADKTTNRISFLQIYEVQRPEWRVVLFQIPPAPKWMPVARDGHYYAREHESLVPLNMEKIERIRQQTTLEDRSAKICVWATIDDLDPEAIERARALYLTKNPEKIEEIHTWDNITFLNKAKVTIQWNITNTAILLLGKPESEHFLSPSVARISWILKDRDDIERDYKHFSCPFLLSVQGVYAKIRNLRYRYIADETLFPEEVDKYDPYVIREALNNCIAHQDYTLAGKINVIEKEDELIFSNRWSFIPQTIEQVIETDAPTEYYRNRFLVEAMVNLNMIDTIWSWIKKMFISQKNKYFPLPEYDLTGNRVTVTIVGKVIDLAYARKLVKIPTLSLYDIILLDKIQKKKRLQKAEIKHLKEKWLVEWISPNLYISADVAQQIDEKSEYIRQRGFKDNHYKQMILEYLEKYKSASKQDIDWLILDILPAILDKHQKANKVRNIIYSMSKRDKTIVNTWSSRYPKRTKV